MVRSHLAIAICCAVTLGMAAEAHADDINLQGFTDGCFTTASVCPPTSSASRQTVSYGGLTYQNATFNFSTAGGFLGVGAQGQVPPNANFNNFGSFTLTGESFNYGSMSAPYLNFDVLITFTAPPGTTPGNALFTDSVSGVVTATGAGGVFIDFDNAFKTFNFDGGNFIVNVNDVSLTAGNTIALSGNIIGGTTAVPEPASLAMLGIGVAGLVAAGRRKRQAA